MSPEPGKPLIRASVLRPLLSILLLAVLFGYYGGAELLDPVFASSISHFAFACGLLFLGQILNTLRWRMLLAAALETEPPPFLELLKLVMAGSFFNLFLPSTVGGDVLRAEIARSTLGGRRHAYVSILMGRLLALLAVLALGIGSIAVSVALGSELDGAVLLSAFGLLAVSLIAVAGLRSDLPSRMLRLAGLLDQARVASDLRTTVNLYLSYRTTMLRVFLLAILSNIVGQVLVVMVLAQGMGLEISPLFHFLAVPIIILITLAPITVNGMGLREVSFVFLYAPADVAAPDAIALSFLFTAVISLMAGLGGVFLLWYRGNARLR